MEKELAVMKQDEVEEKYKTILVDKFNEMRDVSNSVSIDSEFIERYYGKIAQAKLGMKIVNDFEDALLMNGLAGLNCIELGLDFSTLTQEEFERIPFDSKTVFSEETIKKFNPAKILEDAKNFGLGLETIKLFNGEMLTGKGCHVAIHDENCNPSLSDADIVQYEHLLKTTDENGNPVPIDPNCSIVKYKNRKGEETEYACYDYVRPEDTEHMHGLTVTSLLASKSCGVAKDAKVHFYSGYFNRAVENIIKHNSSCKEEDKILVLSVSQRIKDEDFEPIQQELRNAGCEIVCANNFDKNFNEYTGDGKNIVIPLDLTVEEVKRLKDEFEKYYLDKIQELQKAGNFEEAEKCRQKYENRDKNFAQMEAQLERRDNVKIPTSVTYHQVGQNGFKYQSAYSTSWGIPQIAGLFTLFKQVDRDLTFDSFCDIANTTAIGEHKIINPNGIYEEMLRRKIMDSQERNSPLHLLKQREKAISEKQNGRNSAGFTVQNIAQAAEESSVENNQEARTIVQSDIRDVEEKNIVH